MKLAERIFHIERLFSHMDGAYASNFQIKLVDDFKKNIPILVDDLDFCFEVLAGMHKVGYTLPGPYTPEQIDEVRTMDFNSMTIKEFYNQEIHLASTDNYSIEVMRVRVPTDWYEFFYNLTNRIYKLGYTNKNNMLTDKHCMLAKSYPEHLVKSGYYYIQEKLNGNRCIAYFADGRWQYTSRSQKPKEYPFNTAGLDPNRIYDGEVMTKNKLTNRDFSTTSGLANSKYADKSSLMYFIYDIIDPNMTYEERYQELCGLDLSQTMDIVVLNPLAKVYIDMDTDKNIGLDAWLDSIITKGGEGLIIRDPEAKYYQSKHSGDRKPYLLKYKEVKTCDLRIVGVNEGKGKYEGLIGSFVCESDDGQVKVNVSGMTDFVRHLPPDNLTGYIIEVAYFDISQSKDNTHYSLQFPRFKEFRFDKTETSMF